jgi:hypothetical protein
VPVILEEDIELSGFYPLLTLPADTLQTASDTALVRTCKVRVAMIDGRVFFCARRMKPRIASVLFGYASLPITYAVSSNPYLSMMFNRRFIVRR